VVLSVTIPRSRKHGQDKITHRLEIDKTIEYMHSNLDKKITIEYLAKIANMKYMISLEEQFHYRDYVSDQGPMVDRVVINVK